MDQIQRTHQTQAAPYAAIEAGFALSPLDDVLVSLHDAQNRLSVGCDLCHETLISTVEQSLRINLSEGERRLLTDILLSLLRQAELDLRESLSTRLCAMDQMPERLAMAFAHDVISVAKPVLENSPVLTAEDLLYVIQSKGAEYWRAIARRKAIEEKVISQLAEKGDVETSEILLTNPRVHIPTDAMKCFARLCKNAGEIQEPLIRRPEITHHLALELYWHVGQELRRELTAKHHLDQKAVDAALQDALQDMADTSAHGLNAPSPMKPSGLMVDVARQYAHTNRINDAMLLQTLRRNQLRFFIALFAARTHLNHETVYNLMRQEGGQGLAIAAKGCGFAKENFVSLFLLSRSLSRSDAPVNALELQKAIKYFDTVTPEMAERIMKSTKK